MSWWTLILKNSSIILTLPTIKQLMNTSMKSNLSLILTNNTKLNLCRINSSRTSNPIKSLSRKYWIKSRLMNLIMLYPKFVNAALRNLERGKSGVEFVEKLLVEHVLWGKELWWMMSLLSTVNNATKPFCRPWTSSISLTNIRNLIKLFWNLPKSKKWLKSYLQ